MEEDSGAAVVLRALIYGVCMGALIGGPVAAVVIVVAFGAWSILGALLGLVLGGVGGALVGLACAMVAGPLLAAGRGYLQRRLWFARVCAGAICGLLLEAIALVQGDLPAWGSGRGETLTVVFGFGAAIGAISASYVMTGRKCFVARCVMRRDLSQ